MLPFSEDLPAENLLLHSPSINNTKNQSFFCDISVSEEQADSGLNIEFETKEEIYEETSCAINMESDSEKENYEIHQLCNNISHPSKCVRTRGGSRGVGSLHAFYNAALDLTSNGRNKES